MSELSKEHTVKGWNYVKDHKYLYDVLDAVNEKLTSEGRYNKVTEEEYFKLVLTEGKGRFNPKQLIELIISLRGEF